jgi:hypothetical protein
MTNALSRVKLVPNMVKLRRQLSRQTRRLEKHRALDDATKCGACGQPRPCPTQREAESELQRIERDMRALARKALS